MQSPHPTPATTPVTVTKITGATSSDQCECNNARDRMATEQGCAWTRDFYLDTFFNPVWTSGPNVFSFAENGTIVHPKTHKSESHPGYIAQAQRLASANASRSKRLSRNTLEYRGGVAGAGKEDVKQEEERERTRALAELDKWRQWLPYGISDA